MPNSWQQKILREVAKMNPYDFDTPASFGYAPGPYPGQTMDPSGQLISPMGGTGGEDSLLSSIWDKFKPEDSQDLFGDAGVLGSFANLYSMWQKNQQANKYFDFMDELRNDRLAQYADQKKIYNNTFRQRAHNQAKYMRRPVDQGYINRNRIA
jgi:hypothetical protein